MLGQILKFGEPTRFCGNRVQSEGGHTLGYVPRLLVPYSSKTVHRIRKGFWNTRTYSRSTISMLSFVWLGLWICHGSKNDEYPIIKYVIMTSPWRHWKSKTILISLGVKGLYLESTSSTVPLCRCVVPPHVKVKPHIQTYIYTHAHAHTRLMARCLWLPRWAGTRKQNQSGFKQSKRQWVAVASAGPYASLHLNPDR